MGQNIDFFYFRRQFRDYQKKIPQFSKMIFEFTSPKSYLRIFLVKKKENLILIGEKISNFILLRRQVIDSFFKNKNLMFNMCIQSYIFQIFFCVENRYQISEFLEQTDENDCLIFNFLRVYVVICMKLITKTPRQQQKSFKTSKLSLHALKNQLFCKLS